MVAIISDFMSNHMAVSKPTLLEDKLSLDDVQSSYDTLICSELDFPVANILYEVGHHPTSAEGLLIYAVLEP